MAYEYEILTSDFPSDPPASYEEFANRVAADGTITTALEIPRIKYKVLTGVNRSVVLRFVSEPSAPEKAQIDVLVGQAPSTFVATAVPNPRQYQRSTEPSATDDSDAVVESGNGVQLWDVFYDDVTDHAWVCVDATPGAAKWKLLTGWGQRQITKSAKLFATLQAGGEADPPGNQLLVTDASGDFDQKIYGGTADRGYYEDLVGSATTSTSTTPTYRHDVTPTLIAGRYLIQWSAWMNGTNSSTDVQGHFEFDGEEISPAPLEGSGSMGNSSGDFSGFIERDVTAGAKNIKLGVSRDGGSGTAEMTYSTIRYSLIGP